LLDFTKDQRVNRNNVIITIRSVTHSKLNVILRISSRLHATIILRVGLALRKNIFVHLHERGGILNLLPKLRNISDGISLTLCYIEQSRITIFLVATFQSKIRVPQLNRTPRNRISSRIYTLDV